MKKVPVQGKGVKAQPRSFLATSSDGGQCRVELTFCALAASGTVNQKRLPCPTRLQTPIVPAIASMRARLIASPSPRPRRTVWCPSEMGWKAWNRRRLPFRRDAGPGVLHLHEHGALEDSRAHLHVALVREPDGIGEQLADDLGQSRPVGKHHEVFVAAQRPQVEPARLGWRLHRIRTPPAARGAG